MSIKPRIRTSGCGRLLEYPVPEIKGYLGYPEAYYSLEELAAHRECNVTAGGLRSRLYRGNDSPSSVYDAMLRSVKTGRIRGSGIGIMSVGVRDQAWVHDLWRVCALPARII